MTMRKTPLPATLRSFINRQAHELAGQYEIRQRRELADSALKQWQAGASVEAIAQAIHRQGAVERLRDVVQGG